MFDLISKEIALKLITKIFGLSKIFFVYRIVGISSDLDSFYLLQSALGIVLLINIFLELNYTKEMMDLDRENFRDKISSTAYTLTIIFVSGVFCGFIIYGLGISFLIAGCILGLSIPCNIFLYTNLFSARFKGEFSKKVYVIGFQSMVGLVGFLFTSYLVSDKILALALSVLAGDLLSLLVFFRQGLLEYMFPGRLALIDFSGEKILSILMIGTFAVTDLVDKFFLGSLESGKISLYFLALFPATLVRSVVDLRSSFNAAINSRPNDYLKISFKYFRRLGLLLVGALCAFLTVRVFLWDRISFWLDSLGLLDVNFFNEWSILVLLSMLIFLPLQISFDLLYRLIYLRGRIRTFTLVSLVVFLANILGNYIGINIIDLGTIGVLMSTLFCYSILVLVSLYLILR